MLSRAKIWSGKKQFLSKTLVEHKPDDAATPPVRQEFKAPACSIGREEAMIEAPEEALEQGLCHQASAAAPKEKEATDSGARSSRDVNKVTMQGASSMEDGPLLAKQELRML